MAPPTNLAFQDAGVGAGRAQTWVQATQASTRLFCGFRAVENDGANNPIAGPNDFDVSGGWTPTNVNITADAGAAPDGSTTADKLIADFVNGEHFIELFTARNLIEGKDYTFGFFHKAVDVTPAISPRARSGSDVVAAVPIAGTGDIVSASPSTGVFENVSAEALDLGTGWACASISFRLAANAVVRPGIAFLFSYNSGSFTGTLAGHLAWGAFFYEGDLLGRTAKRRASAQPTGGTPPTRSRSPAACSRSGRPTTSTASRNGTPRGTRTSRAR